MPQSKKPAPEKAASARRAARKPAPAPDPTSAAARDEAMLANLASLRDLLSSGVLLTAQRLQEAVDDTVTRGKMTRRDAEDLMTSLVAEGRRQTTDLLAEVEGVLRASPTDARSSVKSQVKGSVKGSGDKVMRSVDRVRRAAKVGPSFPILDFDELTAPQVKDRLSGLTPAQLRKVRDHERRNRNRVGVLAAIEKRL